MVKTRKEQTEQLEKAAAKGLRFKGLRNMSLSSKISLVILVLVALSAILAPLIAPHDPLSIYTARQAPGGEFLFGTDDKGRDILSRMFYGGRYSLVIGFGATLLALVLGSIIGAIASVSRKWVSEAIMRVLDVVMSIPGIALAAVLVMVFGNSVPAIILAIGLMYTPQIARIVRANIVSEYGEDYVRAVIVSGAQAPWILIKHVLRNCIAPIMVFTVTLVADAIIFEASLTFIGAGIAEPTPTWGNILADAVTSLSYELQRLADEAGVKVRLILSAHPIQKDDGNLDVAPGTVLVHTVGTLHFLPLVDYVITDYSTIAFEAGLSDGTRVMFHMPDHDAYKDDPGLNIDPQAVFPSCCFDDVHEMAMAIVDDVSGKRRYDDGEFVKFFDRYVGAASEGSAIVRIGETVREWYRDEIK